MNCHWVCTNAPIPRPTSYIVSFSIVCRSLRFLSLIPCSHAPPRMIMKTRRWEYRGRSCRRPTIPTIMSPVSFIFFISPCVLFYLWTTTHIHTHSPHDTFLARLFVHFSKMLSKTGNNKKKGKKRTPNSSRSVPICWLHSPPLLNLIAQPVRDIFFGIFIKYILSSFDICDFFYSFSLLTNSAFSFINSFAS